MSYARTVAAPRTEAADRRSFVVLHARASCAVVRCHRSPRHRHRRRATIARGVHAAARHTGAYIDSRCHGLVLPSADLGDARTPYLEAWRRLDLPLARSAASGPLMCFGIGEAAGLLRAYAPHTWSRVTMCVGDSPETVQFGELQVDDYHRVAPPATTLLGVRPQEQPAVAERLEADAHLVVRWGHLVHA